MKSCGDDWVESMGLTVRHSAIDDISNTHKRLQRWVKNQTR
jgi:hypothetical protein